MHRNRQLGWAAVVGTALVLVLGVASSASAATFKMSGTWLMRKGQTFIPLQFATSVGGAGMTHVSMGGFTEAPSPQPSQIVKGSGTVTQMGGALKVPKHRFLLNPAQVLPLKGTMLVQITSMFVVDAPFNTANLAAGGGPGNLTWCPSNPACVVAGSPPGGLGQNGRVIYSPDGAQFGGTMQMGLSNGGIVTVKGGAIPPGVVGHVKFGGSGTSVRNLAVGGMQAGTNTPATEFVKLAPGLLTAPVGGIPASGNLVTMPGIVVGAFPKIMTPMGGSTGQFTTNWAFGHTTGDVIVQQVTGTGGDDFFAVDGDDHRSVNGGGNINTVAGGLARRNVSNGAGGIFQTMYAQFDKVSFVLGKPTPSMSPAGFAAAGALMLLAAGYAVRRRIG